MKKVAVILSGCGHRDGSEIHETTCGLIAIEQNNAEYTCFSIDRNQFRVVNHATEEEVNEKRNILVESARIARKKPKTIDKLSASDFDALFIPGGMGAATNLSSYAYDGEKYIVDKNLENVILDFVKLKKPICAVCIAPIILAKVIKGVKVTFGSDEKASNIAISVGAIVENTSEGEICVDEENKVVTAPCYMLTKNVKVIYEELSKAINKTLNGL